MEVSTDPTAAVQCSCCGAARSEEEVARLHCRSEIAICAGCIDWLAARGREVVRVTPSLPTLDLEGSKEFWSKAGFHVQGYDEGFAFARRDGVELHLDKVDPGSRDRGVAYFHVRNADELHAKWRGAGLPVTEVRDEPWGMREFTVVDPGGNRVRVGQNI